MAEKIFSVLSVTPSLKERCIYVEFTLDVDEDTLTPKSVIIINQENNIVEMFEPEVDGKEAKLKLINWPQPNTEYVVLLQSGIETITGSPLKKTLMRSIVFESEVTSEVVITSPSDFEKTSSTVFSWEEKGDTLENNFLLQVAKENAFYNIVAESVVSGKNSVEIKDFDEEGQYFARVRAQRDDDYGMWSEIVTFVYKKPAPEPVTPPSPTEEPSTEVPSETPSTNEPENPGEEETPDNPPTEQPTNESDIEDNPASEENGDTGEDNEDDDDPVFIIEKTPEMKIETMPVNGETPKESFIFSFDDVIDISGAEIKVYRKDFC